MSLVMIVYLEMRMKLQTTGSVLKDLLLENI